MIETIGICLIALGIYIVYLIKDTHMFQLEEYETKNLFHWALRNKNYFLMYLALTVVTCLFIYTTDNKIIKWITVLVLGATYICSIYDRSKKPEKIALKYTSRVKRIMVTCIILFLAELSLSFVIPKFNFVILAALGIISPINLIIANVLLKPVQKMINQHYINDAKRILKQRTDLKIIGITGSYGKTSSKFILQTILSEKYNTCATPNSFNTPLGNVRTIRENLKKEHQVFISEMGARCVGEIKEVCDIVHPGYGIITSIGKQHLETFKSLDNIIKTKYELIDSLPDIGVAFFPADNEYTLELYKKEKRKKYLYGLENDKLDLDMYIKDIKLSERGCTFTLCTKNDSVECTTKLLGEHNALNILGCAAIAYELGLSLEEIKNGISKIEPIPHRLELMVNANGSTVLDDSFNSNPNGTKVALKVLSGFSGTKIIITPGMVELGDEEYALNKEFGENIARVADIAILVGKNRTKAIQEGLKSAGFNEKNMYVVGTLNEATTALGTVIKPGDTVLFENDLPDNYNE